MSTKPTKHALSALDRHRDRDLFLHQNTADIECTRVDLNHRHAGRSVSVQQRVVDRRWTAVLGQQRRVHVDSAVRQVCEHVRVQKVAKRHDDADVVRALSRRHLPVLE